MPATTDPILIRLDAPSGTITLNRPKVRNAISRELIEQLIQAFEDIGQEKKIRAVILTGSGKDFCSGADLLEMKQTADSTSALQTWHEDVMQLKRLIEIMLRYPKPIIAAINGNVIGSGLALMLAADIVIAGNLSQLQLPEPLRGLSYGITAPLLSFRIGTGKSSSLFYSAALLDSASAVSLGLFHETVADDLIWARSHELAQQFALGSHESHQLNKKMLNETIGESLFTQLSIGAANMAAARTTPAAKEGINAFLEKREPTWD